MDLSRLARLSAMLATVMVSLSFVATASSSLADQTTGPRLADPDSRVAARSLEGVLGPVGQDNGDNGGDNGDNGGDNGGDGGGDNGGDNGSSNDNGSSDNGTGNSNGNGNDNESVTFELPPLPAPPPRSSNPDCTTPGRESAFISRDRKATLRVFPTMTARLRVTITPNYDLLALPPLPGRLAGLLVYDVAATPCEGGAPLADFPAEVNLTIHFTEEDLLNVEESIIGFSWLDPATGFWQHVEKQELNLSQNAIGATITRTGRYIVYEDP